MERAGTYLLRLALAALLLAVIALYFGLAASGVVEWQLALSWYLRHQWSANPLFIPLGIVAASLTIAWLMVAGLGRLRHRRHLERGLVAARKVDVISDDLLRRRVCKQLDVELKRTSPRCERVVDALLGLPVDLGASELMLEPAADRVEVALRMGMNRTHVGELPKSIYSAVLDQLQLIVGLDEPTGGGVVELRAGTSVEVMEVRFSRGEYGPSVSIIVSRRAGYSRTLEEIGVEARLRARIDEALTADTGLVVLAGDAGQGASTTLYAMAHDLHRRRGDAFRVASVEPHVRLELPFMVQMEVGAARMAAILEQLLEEDSDALVVRRVADAATAELALMASRSRLVIVSLEAAGPADALAKLTGWLGGKALSEALRLVLGHRLLGRLCSCREEVGIADDERNDLARFAEVGDVYFAPAGCRRCGGGYLSQRRALFWESALDGPLMELVASGADEAAFQRAARQHGVGPIAPAMDLARDGEVALVDVVRLLDGRW